MDLEKLRIWIQKNPLIAYPLMGTAALVLWSLLMMLTSQGAQNTRSYTPVERSGNGSTIGLSVGGVDQQAYVKKLEQNYYDFEDRVKAMETQFKNMRSINKDLKKQQKEIAKSILKLDEKMSQKMEERLSEFQHSEDISSPTDSLELAVADIKPMSKEDDVYLPMGSFCKGTLLTGVYAAADVNNPLPVLIALDEAFFGPNKTRVPLKGTFVLGRAYGDLVSERAHIQITAISSVLPSGQAFEREDNLGYVTDEFGELGIHGQVIRNTGRALALSFVSGFMSGGAQAVANGEVTSTETQYGDIRHEVTGNPVKEAGFMGLAKSVGRMSDYYEKQAESLIPAIHIRNGATVYFIVQKGVKIDGLPRADYARVDDLS